MHAINYSNCALTREFDRFVYGVGCRQQTTTHTSPFYSGAATATQ